MVAHRSYPAGRAGFRWLIPAAKMAGVGLASDRWRDSPDPALARWPWLPRIATRALGADPGSVRAARDFTVTTLHRWGMAEHSPDIAIVVSELLTNALRHGLPGPGYTGPRRPIRIGLLQPGSWVLCAVADPGTAAPAPRMPGSLDQTGRGLHIICALSDRWGCTTPSQTGKVVWALFCPAGTALLGPVPQQAGRGDPGTWQPGRTSQCGRSAAGQPRPEHRALACDPHPQVTCG